MLFLLLIFFSFNNCNEQPKTLQDVKKEKIKNVIKECEFLELPIVLNANSDYWDNYSHKYKVNYKSTDSLIFDSDLFEIYGILPDTLFYYAFLTHSIGDMIYPTIFTIDKSGNKIDRRIICTGGCAGHAAIDITSCYDSVWLHKDLKIKSISKVVGTVETEGSIQRTINICNKTIVEGFINESGHIKLNRSELIDCSDE